MPETRLFHAWVLIALLGTVGCESKEYCPPGLEWCWARCVDLMTSDRHCGQCDNRCDPQADCIDGRCECNPGYINCSGKCVNLDWDDENCGMCGSQCLGSAECINGGCLPTDRCEVLFPELITCGTECVDPKTDESHCGGCDNTCRTDQVCSNGTCTCFGSTVECGNHCVDLYSDPEHCGACARRCAPRQVCIQGQCATTEIGQPGDPCPYGDVNVTAYYCMPGLVCLGTDDWGLCPGGFDWECNGGIPDVYNPDCVDGVCGFSVCAAECDSPGECPDGFQPVNVNRTCYCFPFSDGQPQLGDPCPFGDVNPDANYCYPSLRCLGRAADGNSGYCPDGDPTECTEYPASQNPDCVDGICGFSFCVAQCDAQGNCPVGFEPADESGTCYCIPVY